MKKILALMFSIMALALATVAFTATTNPSPASSGYTPMVIPIQGDYSTARTGIVKFTAPNGYKIVTASVNIRSLTGTTPTAKVLLKSGSYINYSTTVSTAGTVKAMTAGSVTKIADESTVAVDVVTGGTSPMWRDLTLFILLKRL